MARICFAWELGEGFGHIVRYRAVAQAMVAEGHDLTFLSRYPDRVRAVFGDIPVTARAVASPPPVAEDALPMINSYAEMLYHFGFGNADRLRPRLNRWLDAIAAAAPDVLVVDHSPTVLLANRIHGLPVISSGTGFTIPPRRSPLPPFRYWTMRHREDMAPRESRVLECCNALLREHGRAALATLADLHDADRRWLLSFAEFDHYGEREGERYLGSFSDPGFGRVPDWTAGHGPKVFAYLVTPSPPSALADGLRGIDAETRIYAPRMDAAARERFASERTQFLDEPARLETVADTVDIAITNGGLNTVAALLRAGVVQFVLPDNMERHLVGRRLELTGGGIMAPLAAPGDIAAKLRALYTDRAFRRAARRFAERYRTVCAAQQTAAMMQDIRALTGCA